MNYLHRFLQANLWRRLAICGAVVCLPIGSAAATDLLQAYRLALQNDAEFIAARHLGAAGEEKASQGLAGLLPSLSASASTQQNRLRQESGALPTARADYNSHGYALTLTQPLFRWQNVVAWQQGKMQAARAATEFAQAGQELILRLADAYFALLYARENLSALRAHKAAIAQQLAQAKESFTAGAVTIVDTHEAQARFDLAVAQEIAALSELEIRQRALEVIIGPQAGEIAGLRNRFDLPPLAPAAQEPWVSAAESNALGVQLGELALEIASAEVTRNRAGHYPTLDAVLSHGRNTQNGALPIGGAVFGGSETQQTVAALQLNLPLYQGGLVNSRLREAAENRAAASQRLLAAQRGAAQAARTAWLGVSNGLAQVKALEAALASSESALASNRLGHEVGVRIAIDVLNAEQQVYMTRRDLMRARLDTLLAQLRLQAAVGTLGEADLTALNALFGEAAAR